MLNLYRRHLRACPNTLRTERRCGCPIWVQGTLHEKWLKKSLGVRNWESAQRLVREWEGGNLQAVAPISVKEACAEFLRDCEHRKLGEASVGKYKLLTTELGKEFSDTNVGEITVSDLRTYREKWDLSPISARKKLERLRTFFKFCIDSEWVHSNPATAIKPPLAHPTPTLPFTKEEIEKILWATEVYSNKGVHGVSNGPRLRAFVNLLRYTGLRIRDAVTLSSDKIHDGKLLLYTQKTGQPVFIPLPGSLVEEMGKVNPAGRHYFWSGNGLPKSAVADWQRSLAKLFKLAGIKGHAHRFRDTFSVSLLEAGVPLETVSILLGHNSIRTTERHYAPWVKSRQLALESSIEKAWKLA